MARGYEAQRIAKRVRSSVAPVVEPEMAEFASRVYALTFGSPVSAGLMQFSVLAADAEQAEALGRLRLLSRGDDAESARLVSCVGRDFEYEPVRGILSYESEAEREFRRQAYRARVAS